MLHDEELHDAQSLIGRHVDLAVGIDCLPPRKAANEPDHVNTSKIHVLLVNVHCFVDSMCVTY